MAFLCASGFSYTFHSGAMGFSNLTDSDCTEAGWGQEFIRPLVFQRQLEELVELCSGWGRGDEVDRGRTQVPCMSGHRVV